MAGSAKHFVDIKIKTRRIMVFGKSNDPDSNQVKKILEQYSLPRGRFKIMNKLITVSHIFFLIQRFI